MEDGYDIVGGNTRQSGLLKCGMCGSRFVIADAYRYACVGYLNRGVCSNDLRVPRRLVEAAALGPVPGGSIRSRFNPSVTIALTA